MLIKPLERIHPKNTHWLYKGTIRQHLKRYYFAEQYAKDKKVLDIACGYGYGSEILATQATQVIGIDISEESIQSAIKEYNSNKIEFLVGDAAKIPLQDNSIALAVSFETIEHLPKQNVESYLKELQRVLTPGGKLIISSPDIRGFSLNKISSNHFHEQEWTETSFKQLIEEYFKIENTYAQELTPTWIISLVSFFAVGRFSHIVQKLWRAIRYWIFCSGEVVERDINDSKNTPVVTLLVCSK